MIRRIAKEVVIILILPILYILLIGVFTITAKNKPPLLYVLILTSYFLQFSILSYIIYSLPRIYKFLKKKIVTRKIKILTREVFIFIGIAFTGIALAALGIIIFRMFTMYFLPAPTSTFRMIRNFEMFFHRTGATISTFGYMFYLYIRFVIWVIVGLKRNMQQDRSPFLFGIMSAITFTYLSFYSWRFIPIGTNLSSWPSLKTLGEKLCFVLWLPTNIMSRLLEISSWRDVLMYNFGTLIVICSLVIQIWCYYIFGFHSARFFTRMRKMVT